MKYTVTINDKVYEVEVERGQANIVQTTTIAAPQVAVAAPSAPVASAPAVSVVSGVGQTIQSPLPGTINDVKVKEGTVVKKGDILVIIEAMKMENEIVAPNDGVIIQVITTKGATVSTGDALVVIQ